MNRLALLTLIFLALPACSDSGPSDKTLQAVFATQAQATFTSALWDDPEHLPTLPLVSGDGVTTTASSVADILRNVPSPIYFGPRVAHEDWDGLLKRYHSDPSVLHWVFNEQNTVDAWIARKFERADLIGGWTLGYVDAQTGLPIRWLIDSPEPTGPNIGGMSFKGSWVARGREYNFLQIESAANLYRLTGQTRYAQWAAAQLDFYADNYLKWPPQTSEGRAHLFMQGLDEATNCYPLLNAARVLQGYAGPERYQAWRDKLFMPMAENLRSTSAPMSNIQLWHQAARAAIAMRFGDAAMLDDAQNGPQGITAIMRADLSVDNFWVEGTFSYNAYVITCLGKLLTLAGIEGHADRFATLRDQALRLLLVTLDYRFDDNSLPNPNDSIGAQDVIPRHAHRQLYRVAPTWWGLQFAHEWRTWESLLDPPAPIPDNPPTLPTAKTRNFPAIRLAVLRAGSWQAFVHYGQVNGNHVQQELTNFELHDGMTTIARDPGTVDYGSRFHKEYFRAGPANNVPLIDGQGQTNWAPGQLDEFDATQNRLTVTQARYQNDASVTRSYRLTTHGFVERSMITVPSGQERRLGVVFSTACRIALNKGTQSSIAPPPLPDVTAMTNYWSHVAVAQGDGRWEATLDCGARRYRLRVSGPASMTVYTGEVPDTPLPATRSSIYYEVRANSAAFQAEITAQD